ncbi:eotaxin-like [Pempheris klunzingeri]|uniref:eotaxin-like n=1 Tax=Pempheris klunzingeri TaxID=3127111 RepID=UPI003980704C
MRFSLMLAALLCVTTWMTMVQATHGPVPNCCLMWSTDIVPVRRIMNYTIQSEGVCPIRAIIFKTKSGKRICSDPDSNWAKKACLKVDKETKMLLEKTQNQGGSTSDITPAVSTMLKRAPRKKGRNGRRLKSRRGRRRQRKRV